VRLRALPLRVAIFGWRARRVASRIGDQFSLVSATRAPDLAVVLRLGRGRRHAVEIGTGTGWTSIALALADHERTVVTFDPVYRPERERYLELVDEGVRERITFVNASGSTGPQNNDPIELLYIDGDHDRKAVIEDFSAWQTVLSPTALVVFDDFTHPEYPGVREAVRDLGLEGRQYGSLFIHGLERTQHDVEVGADRGPSLGA